MLIQIDDLSTSDVCSLLAFHVADLQQKSPSESCYVLDITSLQKPEITVYSARDNDQLHGCAALKELSPTTGEIKSMRTAPEHLRKGAARNLLQHLIIQARERGYEALYLETGVDVAFAQARTLYLKSGFDYCGPYGDYVARGPNCFMKFELL
ncbi:GNAT family N-acetyltransferase [Penicillium malachiteum]|nr:GNAT family N-acetyltransferase [Penicillium malachiteum]